MIINNTISYTMKTILRFVLKKVLDLFPLQKKVLFINFSGKGYGDNPKYIANEILRQNLGYKLIWAISKGLNNHQVPKRIKVQEIGSLAFRFSLATSKVIVTNTKNDFTKKRKGQYLIQTWHAIYGTKCVEKDIIDCVPDSYIETSKKNSAITDVFISGCNLQSDEYRRVFWCTSEVMESGLPRDDIFFDINENRIAEIRREIKVPEYARVCLFAPTFRKNNDMSWCTIDFQVVKNLLKKKFNCEWIVLTRLHPHLFDIELESLSGDGIINVTKYPDMQELLVISDLLITDYSSSVYDFSILKRPAIIYAPDVHNQTKPLKEIFWELPFPICLSDEDVYNAIDCFDEKQQKTRIDDFCKKFISFDDGHASERVVERIVEVIES